MGGSAFPDFAPAASALRGRGDRIGSYFSRTALIRTLKLKTTRFWSVHDYDYVSKDDEPPEDEDLTCPMILLITQEKQMLREPWREAVIVKLLGKGVGYMQLKKRLKTKWALRGDFSLIDIGHDYYVT